MTKENAIPEPNHDFCYVTLIVEFLPGFKFHAPISNSFCDIDVAKQSLKHIQKQYPKATLAFVHTNLPADDASHIELIKKRDEKYRNLYLGV